MACHVKSGPPCLVLSGPNISKYLDPRITYFNFAEIFGPPELKFLNYLDHLKIHYPPLICIKCTVQMVIIYFT